MAAKRLGIDVLNFDAHTSSTSKGETLLDTFRALTAMKVNAFVVRHREAGIPSYLAQNLPSSGSIINAGDGNHTHPTQALLDTLTIQQYFPKLEDLSIAIVGDISHSHVARSQVAIFQKLGIRDIRLIGPPALIPSELTPNTLSTFNQLNEDLKDVYVIIVLRIQKVRKLEKDIPVFSDHFQLYRIKPETLLHTKKNTIIMRPAPTNREIDIASGVADGPQSVILKQITNGVAIRMAILDLFLR